MSKTAVQNKRKQGRQG